jgi:hypothetical protein
METITLWVNLFLLGFLTAQLIYTRWLNSSSARFNAACERTQSYREWLEQCEKERDRYFKNWMDSMKARSTE